MTVTYTALITLAILREDLTRLDRQGLVVRNRAGKRIEGSFLLLPKFVGLIEREPSLQIQQGETHIYV